MRPMRDWNGLDWFAFVYMVVAVLVFIAYIAVHLIGPW